MTKTVTSDEVLKIFREFGKQGGVTTKKRYGTKHFSEAGKLGMARRWGKRRKKPRR
jgi:hypothetical protein